MILEGAETVNKDIILKVKNFAGKTAKKAAKLSGDALDIAKLKLKIVDINSKLDEKYAAIGLAVYEDCDNDEIETICAEISELREELTAYKIKLSEYSGKKTCPECGKDASRDDEFCPKCGSKF